MIVTFVTKKVEGSLAVVPVLGNYSLEALGASQHLATLRIHQSIQHDDNEDTLPGEDFRLHELSYQETHSKHTKKSFSHKQMRI